MCVVVYIFASADRQLRASRNDGFRANNIQ